MVETDDATEEDPVCQPHLVRLLRRRPKLVDIEMRDKTLLYLEQTICERRKPGRVAEKTVRAAEEVAEPAAMGSVRDGLNKANSSVFKRL